MNLPASERAHVSIDGDVVRKRFSNSDYFYHEWAFYKECPWAAPELVNVDESALTLTVERGQPAGQEYAGALAALVLRLFRHGVHHRDLHPGNVVVTAAGVRLIDWETAIMEPGTSYDFCGPVDIAVPYQHGGLLPQWWDSNDPGSIKNVWSTPVPDWVRVELHSR